MAKPKLPTADSFMAMLDRIPADDEVAQPLAVAEPSPTPAAEVTPTIALVPPKPVKATLVVPPSPAPDAMSDGQLSDREISDSQPYNRDLSDGDIYDRQLPNGGISDRDTSNGQTSNGDMYDRQPFDGGIVDYTTVERSTIPPSDIRPLNIPQSDISRLTVPPSDIPLPDSKTSDREISDGKISDRSIYDLPYNQVMVLRYLINAPGRTSMKAISIGTGVKVPSTKDAVSRLVRRGFLANPSTIRTAEFQGFAYVLNRHMVDRFLEGDGLSDRDISNRSTYDPSTVEYTTVQPLDISPLDSQRSDRQIVHSSSSFLESKLTTTTGYPTVGQSDMQPPEQPPNLFVLIGAVAAYWEEEGLSEAQARKWCLDFEVEPPTMRQQLAWAQFDLETNSRRAEVKKDTISWFFGHLRKTGGAFPRPVNYKSPAELRAEAMEADLEQERAAKERIRNAEAEKRFQGILADPEGADYQKLYAQVNAFSKEAGGDALVHALRDAFNGSDV